MTTFLLFFFLWTLVSCAICFINNYTEYVCSEQSTDPNSPMSWSWSPFYNTNVYGFTVTHIWYLYNYGISEGSTMTLTVVIIYSFLSYREASK